MKIKKSMMYFNLLLSKINLHPIWLFVILFSIAMSKSTIILSSFFPPASIMLITGISFSLSKLNIILVWLAITLGATIGSIISYCLGCQITNKKIFHSFLNRYQITINNAYNKLKNQGFLCLFSSRFIAILRYVIPLVAGMILMNRTKVYSIFLLSATIWSAMFILIIKSTFIFIV
ncbi:Inner membrane protein YqjA [Candidatus Arsenophonus lipoptenae]|uniref:Inner membrane protein YqjA n=1 Tax=Candidatus Arsenophonus lipoptenae TaxID=634113 RepID=A0A0X9VT10_9GAMM|nr:VTT domain-containing protein [Candidatus Arsenophonus lipoptenae]AMA65027.1 Inner membrane protein YqjA [Candidatus Arsenophonus lipoptenae]